MTAAVSSEVPSRVSPRITTQQNDDHIIPSGMHWKSNSPIGTKVPPSTMALQLHDGASRYKRSR
eukprot:scaffold10044_cov124-Skeletonema_menzelii.AAC.3